MGQHLKISIPINSSSSILQRFYVAYKENLLSESESMNSWLKSYEKSLVKEIQNFRDDDVFAFFSEKSHWLRDHELVLKPFVEQFYLADVMYQLTPSKMGKIGPLFQDLLQKYAEIKPQISNKCSSRFIFDSNTYYC